MRYCWYLSCSNLHMFRGPLRIFFAIYYLLLFSWEDAFYCKGEILLDNKITFATFISLYYMWWICLMKSAPAHVPIYHCIELLTGCQNSLVPGIIMERFTRKIIMKRGASRDLQSPPGPPLTKGEHACRRKIWQKQDLAQAFAEAIY